MLAPRGWDRRSPISECQCVSHKSGHEPGQRRRVCSSGDGLTPLSYQWRKNGVNLGGATASSLLLTNVDVPDVGRYSVWVTNAYGSALSEPAILTLASLDLIYASCKDSVGNLYIVGRTCAPDFPVTPGAYCTNSLGGLDAFVAKFDTNMNTLLACTLLGGEGDDEAHSVAVDSAGNVWVAGDTKSSKFPITSGAYQAPGPLGLRDIFVTKLNSNLTAVLASTRLGGDNYDANFAIAVNSPATSMWLARPIRLTSHYRRRLCHGEFRPGRWIRAEAQQRPFSIEGGDFPGRDE